MSEASEFQQYADEALRRALKSRTDKEKLPLIELARTWTQAAYAIEHPTPPAGAGCGPTDHGTAR
jgi:hypothetical protein